MTEVADFTKLPLINHILAEKVVSGDSTVHIETFSIGK